MSKKIFITGTDTGVGKTYVSCQLLNMFNASGRSTIGLKPIASGSIIINNQHINEDALALQSAASIKLDYELVNPFLFSPPIAPHIAAKKSGKSLSVNLLSNKLLPAFNYHADIYIIEGVGGWLVPINEKETMADFVVQENFDVILVVGIRLGCINHALLTAEALKKSNINLIGWIANCMEQDLIYQQEIIDSLKNSLDFSLLAEVNPNTSLTFHSHFFDSYFY